MAQPEYAWATGNPYGEADELRFDLTTSLFSQEPFVQGVELGEVFAKHLT